MAPRRLILDSGAVIGLARRDHRTHAQLKAAWEAHVDVEVPAVVVAETLRGRDEDAPVHRVLKAVGSVCAVTEDAGRLAGQLLGQHDSSATIDALVVATASSGQGATVLTSDQDLVELASHLANVRVELL